MLVIDCCIRGEDSATRRFYRAYLEAHREIRKIETLELAEQNLAPLTAEGLSQRTALLKAGKLDDPSFDLARQFRDADEILIAAPYWDLSFPSLLKVYLERVCVTGITFGYTAEGIPQGYCRAKRLLYFSTAGGFVGERHLGFEYVRAVAGMLGIADCRAYTAEGLDVDPERREEVLARAVKSLKTES